MCKGSHLGNLKKREFGLYEFGFFAFVFQWIKVRDSDMRKRGVDEVQTYYVLSDSTHIEIFSLAQGL